MQFYTDAVSTPIPRKWTCNGNLENVTLITISKVVNFQTWFLWELGETSTEAETYINSMFQPFVLEYNVFWSPANYINLIPLEFIDKYPEFVI
jgi:hypothetical protein